MARAYYSTVLDESAERVWSVIRSFDNYAWAGTGIDATMEDVAAGDAVGGVRRVDTPGGVIRQRLLAHSDLERSYSYEFCDPIPFPVRNYLATLRVTPVVDGQRSFVEWWATFDCSPDEIDKWVDHFEREGFARWLAALRTAVSG